MTKLLQVLGALMCHGTATGVGLQELAREVGLPLSTVHRILKLCVSYGMAMQVENQRYTVGPALLAAGLGAAEDLRIKPIAHAALQELADQEGEEVYLTMRMGNAGIFADRSASPRPIRVIEPLFEQLPLHCGASRKVLLAYSDEEFIEEYLAQDTLTSFTENTITDRQALRAELEKIRGQGYGISIGERSIEISGVAAPVFGPWGRILASVSILAPAATLQQPERLEKTVPRVKRAADQISERLRGSLPARPGHATREQRN